MVSYFIGTSLLVLIHILYTQKWAAQCDAPLRSGEHTLMGEIIHCNNFKRSKYYIMWMRKFKYVIFMYECTEFVAACTSVYDWTNYLCGKCLLIIFSEIYFMNTHLAVCCFNNESQIWWNNVYTPSRGRMLGKGFGYHFDRHFDRYFDRHFNKKEIV